LNAPSTDRLILRQWRDADRDTFFAMNADPMVMKYFPDTLDRAQSDSLLGRFSVAIEDRGWGFWAVELKSNRDLIGFVGLNIPTAPLPFAPCVEVGWRLRPSYWGAGLATEAARASLIFGFEVLGLTKIVSFTSLGNTPSIAVMKRLGMKEVGEFDHPAVPVGNSLRTHVLYETTR
jgi:RimJ/RimL family protein N-acetyltransferase